MIFTVFGKPKGKARPRFTRQGHAYTPDSTREYEQEIKAAFLAAGGKPIAKDVPVTITITAWYAIPKSASKALRAKMASGQLEPIIKPDWDNIGKLVCDALNGVAWHDDAQVTQAKVTKVYGITPMVMVEITENIS